MAADASETSFDAPPGATRRTLDLGDRGVALSLLEWGDPKHPIALFSHANGFCAAMWTEVAEALQQRFRVVAIDARGQGHSPVSPDGSTLEGLTWGTLRDDLIAVSERLLAETGQAHIALGAGHSFGGTLTLAAEARVPGRFSALLALDPVILPARTPSAGRGSELAAGARRRRAVFASRAAARASFAEKRFFAGWTERALDLYVDFGLKDLPPDAGADSGGEAPRPSGSVGLRCAPEVEAGVFEAPIDFDILEEVARIEAPVRVLWAAQGHFPRALHAALVERIPHGALEEADAGHLLLMQKPALVRAAIDRLLADAQAGGAGRLSQGLPDSTNR